MAKGINYGVSDLARRVRKLYYGVMDLARKTLKGYVGDEHDIARMFYSADEEVTITSSRTWTVPDGATTIDVFAVGGGGGAGGSVKQITGSMFQFNSQYTEERSYGASGGGGYTTTSRGIAVTGGETLNIVIGAGGTGGNSFYNDNGTNTGEVTAKSAITNGSSGGETYVARGNTKLVSASGGAGGNRAGAASGNYRGTNGVNGGNASGAAGGHMDMLSIDGKGNGKSTKEFEGVAGDDYRAAETQLYGNNGAEGGNGGNTDVWWQSAEYAYSKLASNRHTGGTGQGRNTRRFGQAGATVYSTVATTVSPNTGNSGPLGLTAYTDKNGSSGVVIIAIHY